VIQARCRLLARGVSTLCCYALSHIFYTILCNVGVGSGNGSSGSPGHGGGGGSSSSSPNSNRAGYREDPMTSLPGGSAPSSAASAAIESLLPTISVSKRSVPGKSAEIVRASIILPGLDEQTDLDDWRAVLECTGARKICMETKDSSGRRCLLNAE